MMCRSLRRLSVLFPTLLVCLAGLLVLCFFVLKEENSELTGGAVELPGMNAWDSKGDSNPAFPSERLFKLYSDVEIFVLFIGYPRSSHSLMGSLLDAHPEIIIPHEYDIMASWQRYRHPLVVEQNLQKYLLFYDLHKCSMTQAMFGIRAKNYVLNRLHHYSYHVPSSWQGGYKDRIKVIGDKKGGDTSAKLRDPNNMALLEEIAKVVEVPIKFIHVTRNPFDNIATMLLEALGKRYTEEESKANNPSVLDRVIEKYFSLVEANDRVKQRYGDAVIDIPGHELVLRPRQTLRKLCDHLQVTCSEEYIEQCRNVTYGSPSVTRNNIVWTTEQKARVTEKMMKYSFLKDFSFDEIPK